MNPENTRHVVDTCTEISTQRMVDALNSSTEDFHESFVPLFEAREANPILDHMVQVCWASPLHLVN